MDKIFGREIDKSTIEKLNQANLNSLNALVETMHKNIICENLLQSDLDSKNLMSLSDNLVTEMSFMAQNFVKITFLLDKMENMLDDSV
jgi:hypothetical protein